MPGPRRMYPAAREKSPGLNIYRGTFVTANTSAPSVITGSGFTVSAPSTGTYTITITDGLWTSRVSARAEIQDASANSTARARIGTINSDGTFTIITSSSAGTDANLTGPTVSFEFCVRNTGLTK